MKLERSEIRKLISVLIDIQDNLKEGEVYDFKDVKLDSLNINQYDDFKFPEKWAIKAYNEENAKVIYPWLNKTFGHGWMKKEPAHHKLYCCLRGWDPISDDSKDKCTPHLAEGFTEVTVEQFKKYVLKQ